MGTKRLFVFEPCLSLQNVFLVIMVYGSVATLQISSPPSIFKQLSSEEIQFQLGTDKLVLDCEAFGNPQPTYKWFKNGQPLNYKSNPRWTQLNSYRGTLVGSHLTAEDEGVYRCEATNRFGTALSNSVSIKKFDAPRWITVPNDTNVGRDDKVRFECVASGDPEPNIEWFVNGVNLSLAAANPRRKLVSPTVLTIDDLKSTDTAVYQCRASNHVGHILKNFFLNVLYIGPIITEPPEEVYEVLVGDDVTLRCRFLAFPKATVKWTYVDLEMKGKRFAVQPNGDLHISNVSRQDFGQYRCNVENVIGETFSRDSVGLLLVREKTRITEPPEDKYVYPGISVWFRCEVVSDKDLPVVVQWQFNGKTIDFKEEPQMVSSEDNSLKINGVTESDSGVYSCVAQTKLDNVTAQATLTVKEIPKPPIVRSVKCNSDQRSAIIEWSPAATVLQMIQISRSRSPVLFYRIHYNTSSNPDVWETADVRIPANALTYEISLKPWTNYTFAVTAHNNVGMSQRSGHSSVCQTQPDVPYSNPNFVKDLRASANTLVISWAPMTPEEHNGPGFFYRVLYKRSEVEKDDDDDWKVKDVVDWEEKELIVKDQPTYVPYIVRIEAHNALGKANQMAADLIVYSAEDKPLASPQNLRLVRIVDSNTAEIEWDPVPTESVCGQIKGYKIQTYNSADESQSVRQIVVKGTNSSVSLDILTPYTNNFVRVRVFNGLHDGPPSNVITITTPEGVPGSVSSFNAYHMGSTALWLTWRKPTKINGNLKGYRIFYDKRTSSQSIVEPLPPINNPDATSVKLSGLERNIMYRIGVQAVTGAGLGSPSYIETFAGSDIPTPPKKPSFAWMPTDQSGTAIKVTWIPNLHGNPGSHFYVEYKQEGDTHQWKRTEMVMNDDNVVIKDLSPGTYEVKLAAVDGDYQETSDVQEINTIEAARKLEPTSPWTRLESIDGDVNLKITWNPLNKKKNVVDGTFSVKYKKAWNSWKKVSNVPYNESVTINGLSKKTVYEINVFASDEVPKDWQWS